MKIELDKSDQKSYYIQIYNFLKKSILSGELKEGEKLYSIRHLAKKLQVNQNTIIQSYELLEQKGLIVKIVGKGCFVNKSSNFKLTNKEVPLIETFKYGQLNSEEIINFYNGTPKYTYFPVEEYKKIFNEVLEKYGGEVLQYQNVQGDEELRKVLAENFEKDDIFVSEKNIQVTSGTQQALDILIRLFSKEIKPTVVISNPTYPNAINIFKESSVLKSIDSEIDGWNLETFESILKEEKIDFIYLVANFQNPTGFTWSLEKKERLIELSKKYDFYIVEDDSFSDFYYQDKKPESLKSLDKIGEERVFYIKTYSKILMPGIGLAIMLVPPKFIDKILLIKYGLDTTTSGVNQKILKIFIENGKLEEHISFLRKAFKEKLELTLKKLKTVKQIKIINIPKGGFFIWLELKKDGEEFCKECKKMGVELLPGTVFSIDGKNKNKIRLSFISPNLNEIVKGIDVIKSILSV